MHHWFDSVWKLEFVSWPLHANAQRPEIPVKFKPFYCVFGLFSDLESRLMSSTDWFNPNNPINPIHFYYNFKYIGHVNSNSRDEKQIVFVWFASIVEIDRFGKKIDRLILSICIVQTLSTKLDLLVCKAATNLLHN